MNTIPNCPGCVLQISAALLASLSPLLLLSPSPARADIFQWEYINPADPSQGKQQSTTLAPDGAGVDAVPGADLSFRNLSMAYLIGADLINAHGYWTNLTNADLSQANLTNADFSAILFFDGFWSGVIQSDLTSADLSQANLRSANFTGAILTDANFGDADVRGAKFGKSLVYYQSTSLYGTGITPAQLSSSASYHAKDLSDIGLEYHNLDSVNFAGQNLTNASFRNATLTSADFTHANLTGAELVAATLTGANLTQANINNASLIGAALTGVDFTNAQVQGADLTGATYHGFTAAQLYSTYSYQAKNLTAVSLIANNHAGWNFASQNMANSKFSGADLTGSNLRQANLTNADFGYVTLTNAGLSHANLTDADFSEAYLTGADFSDAEIRGANFQANAPRTGITLSQLYSTASYQVRDLTGVWFYGNNLSDGNFVGQNLTNVFFDGATLTGADFADSLVRGAIFSSTTGDGFTAPQLYSTASYRSHDLTRIVLGFNDLSGWNFVGQNLTDADFYLATLSGANFNQANLTNAYFGQAMLTDAHLSAADARGAFALQLTGAVAANLIRADGHIDGLVVNAGGLLVVRDYDGGEPRWWRDSIPPIPITIDEHLTMDAGGTMRMVFEADAWDSTISFAPGIPVTLGGTLELTFADNIDLTTQLGRTLKIFNWTGVDPTGAFAISGPYAWDLSNFYTTGEVKLTAIPEPTPFVLFAFAAAVLFVTRRTRIRAILHRSLTTGLLVSLSPLLLVSPSPDRADIFQWEYIDPADPNQGKRPSTTLCPDGAGLDAVPGAKLFNRNLTMAYLMGANLMDAIGHGAKLTNADLTLANLNQASFVGAALTNANFTGAEVRKASFGIDYGLFGAGTVGTGITLPQLYSTASYRANDLSGIGLGGNYLPGGNFDGKNLAAANFKGATLTDADFTAADVRGASFSKFIYFGMDGSIYAFGTGMTPEQLSSTANYDAHELSGICLSFNNLAGGNFVGQNLTDADFSYAKLMGADFAAADVRGANFETDLYLANFGVAGPGIALAQLYSTASYQAHDLSGIGLFGNNLAGADFSGQNLSNASFFNAKLSDADFTAADTRGALGIDLSAIRAANLILPDGHLNGLDLEAGALLVVRDYDGDPRYLPLIPIPITVDRHFAMGPSGTLRMVFEADAWDSTISFAPGIPVTLGGTLELTFADNVNLASQLGRTFDLFNWTGVTRTGAFAVSSPYAWNLSNLYTTGQVTLNAIPEPCSSIFEVTSIVLLTLLRRQAKNFLNANLH
jgi:uncharacterized protein YjbI with pentapeptide repeats